MGSDLYPVYITGRAHSGTTVTDVLIGNAKGVESIGEILSGLNRGLAEDCSCGLKVADCEYWRAVARIYREKYGSDLYEDGKALWRQSDVRRFFSALFANFGDPNSFWGRHAMLSRQILSAIAEHSGKAILLDSNKEYTRSLVYLKSEPNAKIIHLFRRPVSVISSHYYRIVTRQEFKFLKKEYKPDSSKFPALMIMAFAWSLGMVLACIVKARYPARVLHVSYEKLCDDPKAELARVGRFIGVDMSDVIAGVEEGRTFPIGHNVGGNELRHEGGYRFIRNTRGRREIPPLYRYGAAVFSFPGVVLQWLFVRA